MQGVFKNHLNYVWFILLAVEYQNVVKCKQNTNKIVYTWTIHLELDLKRIKCYNMNYNRITGRRGLYKATGI
jgi:hypothetical protein